jgi:esterase/lipase
MSTVPSTTIITNLKNVTAPTANTISDATSCGLDMPGMLALALTKAYELKECLTLIAAKTDSADPNLTTLNDVLASLT